MEDINIRTEYDYNHITDIETSTIEVTKNSIIYYSLTYTHGSKDNITYYEHENVNLEFLNLLKNYIEDNKLFSLSDIEYNKLLSSLKKSIVKHSLKKLL